MWNNIENFLNTNKKNTNTVFNWFEAIQQPQHRKNFLVAEKQRFMISQLTVIVTMMK